MKQYHKIQTVFKRDPSTNNRTLLDGQFSIPEFEYLQNNTWVFTEKVDGTNIRVMHEDGIRFAGKSDKASLPSDLATRLNERFLPQKKLFASLFPDAPVCFYGEGYGAKIQKGGGNYRSDQDFVLFDVKVGDWWLQRKDVEDIAIQFDIDVVPIVGAGSLRNMVMLARGDGIKSSWGNFQAEGIVARPSTELKARNGDRIITKIKTKDFAKEGSL